METGTVIFSEKVSIYEDANVTGLFSSEGTTAILFGRGLFAVDLKTRDIVYSEPQSLWHWGVSRFSQVMTSNFGEIYGAVQPSMNQKLFDVILPPTEILQNTFRSLRPEAQQRIAEIRPAMAR